MPESGSENANARKLPIEIGHLQPIDRQNLHAVTTVRLARLVVDSKPGDRLPTEQELCIQLGVGRSTLREAVRALSFIGAVKTRQGSGTYIRTPEQGSMERLLGLALVLRRSTIQEIVEMRRVLEVEAARLAALNHSEDERRNLQETMEKMRTAAREIPRAADYDLQYHVLIARASHNGVLEYLINGMRALLQVWMNYAVNAESVVDEILVEHNRILSAIFDRDSDLAAAAMSAHLKKAADRLLAVVGKAHSTTDYLSTLLEIPGS